MPVLSSRAKVIGSHPAWSLLAAAPIATPRQRIAYRAAERLSRRRRRRTITAAIIRGSSLEPVGAASDRLPTTMFGQPVRRLRPMALRKGSR